MCVPGADQQGLKRAHILERYILGVLQGIFPLEAHLVLLNHSDAIDAVPAATGVSLEAVMRSYITVGFTVDVDSLSTWNDARLGQTHLTRL